MHDITMHIVNAVLCFHRSWRNRTTKFNEMLRCAGLTLTIICWLNHVMPTRGYGTPHLVPKITHETSAAEVQEWAWGTMLMLYNLSFPGEPPSGKFLIQKIKYTKHTPHTITSLKRDYGTSLKKSFPIGGCIFSLGFDTLYKTLQHLERTVL